MLTREVFGESIFINENMGMEHEETILQFQMLESCICNIFTKAFSHSSGLKFIDHFEAIIKENDKDKYDEVSALFRPIKTSVKSRSKKFDMAVTSLVGAIHHFNGTYLFIDFLTSLSRPEKMNEFAQGEGNHSTHSDWANEIKISIRKVTTIKNRLIEANQGLIVQIVKSYIRSCTASMTPIDLLQECNLGMFTAIEKFDWKRGNRFSTYAAWWIRNSIRRAIADRGHTIRLPSHVNEKYMAIKNAKDTYYAKHGYWPSTTEVSAVTELTEEQIQSVMRGRIFSNGQLAVLSMEAPIKTAEDTDLLLEDTLADSSTPDFNKLISSHEIRGVLESFMETLTPRERTIIRMRFGFDKDYESDADYNLADIGKVIGISRERVRQIQYDILKRMKESISHLSPFNPN